MPRGRPKTLDESEVLDRATDLMWRDGPQAHSLNELAAALGVSKPALSKMFGDKAQFHAAILKNYHARLVTPLEAKLEGAGSVRAAAETYLDHFLHGLSAKPVGPNTGCLLAATTESCAGSDGEVAETAHELNAQTDAALTAALRRAGASDPGVLARYLYGQSVARAFLSRTGAGAGELRAVRDRALLGVTP